MVAEEAGVSRGAMLHQFRTKAELMTFVVASAFEEELELYAELLKGTRDPRERLLAYPMAVWTVLSRPAGVAVLEILQGSRSDPDLAARLGPVQANINDFVEKELERQFPRGPNLPLVRLIVGAARGLSVTQVISPGEEDAMASVRLLERLLAAGMEARILSPGRKKAPRTQKL